MKPTTTKASGPRWRGMVVLMGPGGTRWARVSLPESTMHEHLVGEIEAPDMRGIVASKIESELMHDKFVDGRGWPK